MSRIKLLFFSVIAMFANIAMADIVVQLNTNRPINDVSDKFVSFTMKSDDLYEALDGEHRTTITRMASMLSDAHIKFVGDYYFANEKETNLRNPTKIVWKGFNKWTKAIKWSMVVPVPYAPNTWDPMETLKILNNSQSVGISDCIWQLGTDFGSSAASDYVTELKTFNLMVDSFRHSVNKWQIMGADISAGSCPDETRRYIEMTRDLNAAYGWTESTDMFMGNSLTSALSEQDPALKVLLDQKVPVWLTLPKNTAPHRMSIPGDIYEGLDWAQTMGDAANTGFNTIFKHISLEDWESPKYSFYVTALFKKIMGSRVFPARPLGFFGRNNKLYTHCSNDVSGGLAFMVVNKQEIPMQIAIKSTSKLQDNELWQYVLTMSNGQIRLNNKRISLESNLQPEIKRKQPKSMLQLKAPALSVSFWVLPNIEMEHCQFTEVDESGEQIENEQEQAAEEEEEEEEEQQQQQAKMTAQMKRYSTTDRFLKELLKETATPLFSSGRKVYRHRRSLKTNERPKRFVLENEPSEKPQSKSKTDDDVNWPFKRDLFSPERRRAAMKWLTHLMRHDNLNPNYPLLRRSIRNSDGYMGPFFMTRDGKKTAFTKKITEIKKPEKKLKRLYEDIEFDEEKFFKNVGVQPEPEYVKLPEGDVFIQSIASNGNEDAEEEEHQAKSQRGREPQSKAPKSKAKKEIVNEMKPLRLLPTEFYESLPVQPAPSLNNKLNLGNAFNSLFFPDSFGKTFGKGNDNVFGKVYDLKEDQPASENIDETDGGRDSDVESVSGGTGEDFLNAQLNMRNNNKNKSPSENEKTKTRDFAESDETGETTTGDEKRTFFQNLLGDKKHKFLSTSATAFDGNADAGNDDNHENPSQSENSKPNTSAKFEELPWWDLTPLRAKRSVEKRSWHTNLITKNEEPIVSANQMASRRMRPFQYKVDDAVRNTQKRGAAKDSGPVSKKLVDTLGTQVTKWFDIVSHQVSDLYSSITK